ncbi:MAG: type II 3-dehydroquinate dehydratase [Muribaculaceae bacterium]|nr:type II 3-dehydroquinate dehydratase [Muribaculaceae bacterium]
MADERYILVLNGPNLNMLGIREPEIYGRLTLAQLNEMLEESFPELLHFEQYNGEGEIVTAIQRAGIDPACKGIVLNAGAYTHYSYAIADAIAAVPAPVVEVHISNVHAREEFRSRSVIAPVCAGTIAGFGVIGYTIAIQAIDSLVMNSSAAPVQADNKSSAQ